MFRSSALLCASVLALLTATCSASLCLAAAPIDTRTPAPNAAEFAPDPASITREGKGYRYPQAGWIVVHIEGAPYERGFQHGKLLAAEIAEHIRSLATARSPKAPSEAWRDLRTIVNALFLRGYDSEYLEEMKGIAAGAAAAGATFDGRPLELLDIVAVNSNIEVEFLDAGLEAEPTGLEGLDHPETATPHEGAETDDHCSAFAATGPATADGQIVFGHITMFNLYAVRHFNVWLDIQPAAGERLVFQTYPGGMMSGLDYYINGAGLMCCETTIAQTRFHSGGKPLASRIRQLAQYATSIDKAAEILLASNNGLYSNQWLLGDAKTNEVAMLELGTHHHKFSRSSRKEFPGGTEGFYWANNNGRDLAVRQETVPSLSAKPANLVFHPKDRDIAWQKLFGEHRGRISEAFAFQAFTTPTIAAFRSCDAKFTTTALAKDLKSWALWGPPLGRTWDATPEELRRLSDIQPLVSNDWALLTVAAPKAEPVLGTLAVDLKPSPKAETEVALGPTRGKRGLVLPPAWRGTLLPETDADLWLAAAFSDFEKIVSLEKALRKKSLDKALSSTDSDRLAVASFAPLSQWMVATRRLGRDLPLMEIHPEWSTNNWYAVAAGKGTLLLAALRAHLGAEVFDKAMDEFGKAHGGQKVTTTEFREHLEKTAGHSLDGLLDPWLKGGGADPRPRDNFWSIDSFEAEPERTLIVYGTLQDRAAQREAAELLQRKIARRFSNASIAIVADRDATDEQLKNHHLLLIGRPACNSVSARLAGNLGVTFGSGSFIVRQETYAHADSAIIAAGENRLNSRYEVVIYAGLGARATRDCIENLPNRGGEPTEVLLTPAGRQARSLRIATPSVVTAMP